MADKDVIDLIRDDHEEIRRLFEQIDKAPANERDELFGRLVHELARHEATEEALVHPTLRDEVAQGEAVATSILNEEEEAERLLADMEKMDPEGAQFLDAFRRLRDMVLNHAEHEEREEHPQLRSELTGQRLHEMADGFRRVKEQAPTHPHPRTPQTPEVRLSVGPIAGVFDRARDAVKNVMP
ncbi:MAG: hemerythrin domain-containing protein [Actinobacteria bacterium]|nr:hemerythrin domain-containing protein [Actinomycetota bacterium]